MLSRSLGLGVWNKIMVQQLSLLKTVMPSCQLGPKGAPWTEPQALLQVPLTGQHHAPPAPPSQASTKGSPSACTSLRCCYLEGKWEAEGKVVKPRALLEVRMLLRQVHLPS